MVACFDEAGYGERGPAALAELGRAGRRGALESLTTQDGRVTLVWRFSGLPAEQAPALERLLMERTGPQSLSIVYTSGTAAP